MEFVVSAIKELLSSKNQEKLPSKLWLSFVSLMLLSSIYLNIINFVYDLSPAVSFVGLGGVFAW